MGIIVNAINNIDNMVGGCQNYGIGHSFRYVHGQNASMVVRKNFGANLGKAN